MSIGVAYENKAYRVTIALGTARWEFYDRRVSVDKDRGVVQVYAPESNRILATAPLAATMVEWVKDSGVLTNQPVRQRLDPVAGTPSVGELERVIDDWLRTIGD